MPTITLNRHPIVQGKTSEEVISEDIIRNTPGLFQASLEDAFRYGGELTRHALSLMDFRGDRNSILVEVKVHYLRRGFYPAVPLWHTDGVPRLPDVGNRDHFVMDHGAPELRLQEREDLRPPRYHLFTTGEHATTRFIDGPVEVEIPDVPHAGLYTSITKQVSSLLRRRVVKSFAIPSQTVVEFDWWNLHTAPMAAGDEWRCLVRAVETDHYVPLTDLRKVLRTHSQVYIPQEVGW